VCYCSCCVCCAPFSCVARHHTRRAETPPQTVSSREISFLNSSLPDYQPPMQSTEQLPDVAILRCSGEQLCSHSGAGCLQCLCDQKPFSVTTSSCLRSVMYTASSYISKRRVQTGGGEHAKSTISFIKWVGQVWQTVQVRRHSCPLQSATARITSPSHTPHRPGWCSWVHASCCMGFVRVLLLSVPACRWV
jgi:hypothetical protein